MAAKSDLAKQYVAAQQNREEALIESVAANLAEDVVMISPRGQLTGRDAVLDRLKNPPPYMSGMMGDVTYADPVEEADTVRITANVPPNPMIKGLTLVFGFDAAGRIKSIETQMEQ